MERSALVPGAKPLSGIDDIREFFRMVGTPIYFIAATGFNLLGIDRWVPSFRYITYYDSFDGRHPNIFVPREREPRVFHSIEEICDYLLGHKEVRDHIASRALGQAASAGRACFLMFDAESEVLAREAGLELAFPSAELRHRLDSKIVTTRLGNEAGVPSVPNVLGRARSFEALRVFADGAGLGPNLVVQTPYGDSGETTFFISSEADWARYAPRLVDEELKVMRRIDPRELAMEGVVTRHGTLVGPLMTELTGFAELTPYTGGWCGNEVHGGIGSPELRERARRYTRAIGDRLREEGYRGYFEVDFLADVGSGELYLGELNPRVTGASPLTNTAMAAGGLPLFLFHLLEFMDVEYELDVDALNAHWAEPSSVETWAQWILKETGEAVEILTAAPASGIWRMAPDGSITYARDATDWYTLADESEAFYLRIAVVGDYRYPKSDMGILVARGRFMTDEHELVDRARRWIDGIKARFAGVPLPTVSAAEAPKPSALVGFK